MPDFTDYSPDDGFVDYSDYSPVTQVDDKSLTQAVQAGGSQRDKKYGMWTTLAGDAGLGIVDLADTVLSSTPGVSSLVGLKRGELNQKVLSAVGMPGLTEFYNNNRSGIEVASGIEGIIASEFVLGRAAKSLGTVVNGLKGSPILKRLATLEDQYQAAMMNVRSVDTQLAKSGVTGGSAFTDLVTIPGQSVGQMGPTLFQTTRNAAVRKARGLSFIQGGVRAAASEATASVFLNQNSFLFSEDYGENLMLAGFGVAAGGAFSVMGTGYQMRKFVNSDTMRRLKADALDPTGQEAARLEVDRLTGKPGFMGNLNGWVSDRVTSLMTSAKAQKPGEVDATTYNRLTNQHMDQAINTELPKITNKGLAKITGTNFAHAAKDYWNHVVGGLRKDPGLLYGTEEMGAILPEATISGTVVERNQKITERLDELTQIMDNHHSGQKILTTKQRAAVLTEMKNLKFQQNLTPMALIDQELMPISHAATYDNWNEPLVKSSRLAKDDVLFEAVDRNTGVAHGVGIDSQGNIHLPTGKNLNTADHFDMLRLYRSADGLLTSLARQIGDPKASWTLPSRMVNGKLEHDWFWLDFAEELMQRTDGRANINWGVLSRESAQKESLIQKIGAMRGMSGLSDAEFSKIRTRYNLPRLTSYQMALLGTSQTPLDRFISGASRMSDSELRNLSIQDLRKGYADANNIGDLHKLSPDSVRGFTGNSFNFMKDDEGNFLKPILMFKRNVAPQDWAPDRLAERIAAKKTATVNLLRGPQSGPVVRSMVDGMMSNPDYALASQVGGLHDTQLVSSLPGLAGIAPQSATGALLNSVVQAEWRARDNPIILAVTRLRETVDSRMRALMKQSIEGSFGDTLTRLNGPRNTGSKALLDNFHTFRSGWDLEEKVLTTQGPQGDARHAFVLSPTVGNKNRYKQAYGREMPNGATLLDTRGREVVLDDMGLDVQKRFNAVTEAQRIEKNSLLAAKGLPEIHKVQWYVPSASNQGKFIGFTLNNSGEIVPGGTIVANTKEIYEKELSRMKADPKSPMNSVPGAAFRSRDEAIEYATIWDKAQMEMLDPGTTAIQGGKRSEGFLTPAYIGAGRWDEGLRGLRDSWLNLGNDILEVMLDDPIKAAKSRSAIASGITANADGKATKYRSVYDYWLEAARGQMGIASSGSMVGKLYNPAEETANRLIAEAAPSANRVWQAMADRFRSVNPWSHTATTQKEFEQLSRALGPHMPYESAADMIERRALGVKPAELKDLTGNANAFAATWMLRMLEPMAAVMNLAGVVNSMPAVIRHVSPREGETVEELAARVGHVATIFTGPGGKPVSTIDMGKLAWQGFKRSWAKDADAAYARKAAKGHLSQEVAEFNRQFNAVESKSGLMKFLTGDSTSQSAFGKKGIVGWTSVLTDKSEDFSRSWANFIGDELGGMLGIVNPEARDNFAHDMANKMIANYNPANRIEVFQGAIGAPIGLFQSFMWAYYQRMFRYIETGDVRALATQYAMQSTLFGVSGVPGWNELNDFVFQHTEGKTSPYDGLYQKFGPNGGDLLMAGTLSNLPKLFGLQGADLFSRGDVTARIVTQNPLTNAPAINMVSKLKDGIMQGVHLAMGSNPQLSTQQVGEVLSNMMPNRPLAGWAEIALAGGADTDSMGQLVYQSQTWADATYRMLGLRSMDHSKMLEAYYSNKTAQEIEAAKRETFNTDFRGAIRAGNEEAIPAFIEQYLEDGGDPRQVSRMVQSAYTAAQETTSQRQLDKVMKNPNKTAQVDRLLSAGVGIDADTDGADAVWQDDDTFSRPLDDSNE